MYLIGDDLTVTGLRLAGMKNAKAADETTVEAALGEVPEETKVVLITSSLASKAERAIFKLRKSGIIVTEIPDMEGGGEDVTAKLVKEAVGFDLSK